jgi:hypothetical protein
MNIFIILVVCALVFGICYLVDKGYTNIFRGQAQHKTGLSVRLSKHYAVFGLLLCVLGVAALFNGFSGGPILLYGCLLVIRTGFGLIGYCMTFGIFYDADSFILTTFGKKSQTYRFQDIKFQQLYLIQGGSTVVELHLVDGRSVSVQSAMEGAYPFLDHAFAAWCRQTGRDPESCDFHEPADSCWFPPVEEA